VCSSYTVPLTVGGQPQQAVVEACHQADGSWQITQTTPGLPPQVYEMPAPAYSPYSPGYSGSEAYPYPDFSAYSDWAWGPYWGWAGAPWFFGFAPAVVVIQRFNHFHHGFAHGFGHGFGHGMRGFGGHGFAGMHGFGGHGSAGMHGFGGHGFAGVHGGGMGGGGHR
jgi:surface antigen